MNFTYKSLLQVGAHIGGGKQYYRKQMGFYALGFRTNIYIFNAYKMLVNIINILIILKKSLLYKFTFLGLGLKSFLDVNHILKHFFRQLAGSWLFGKVVGGALSNQKLSLWQSTRWLANYSDYYYDKELGVDFYFIVNTFNMKNMLAEITNDFSIILGLNDSNMVINGLTYLVPYNTKNMQSLYLLFTIFRFFIQEERQEIQGCVHNLYNLNLYKLYLDRLLVLRLKTHKSRFFVNSLRKTLLKRIFVYRKMVALSSYNRYNIFLRKKLKRYRFSDLDKSYGRYAIKSSGRNLFAKRHSFYMLRAFVDSFSFVKKKKMLSLGYLDYMDTSLHSKVSRYYSFFFKNRRVGLKLLDKGAYLYFFAKNLKKKNIVHSPFFYRNPANTYHFLGRRGFLGLVKNFLYVSQPLYFYKEYLTVYKFLRKHRFFHTYIIPRHWVRYQKYTPRSKKIFTVNYTWFLDEDKHLKFNKQKRHKRKFKKGGNQRFRHKVQKNFQNYRKGHWKKPYLTEEQQREKDKKSPAYLAFRKVVDVAKKKNEEAARFGYGTGKVDTAFRAIFSRKEKKGDKK